MFNAAEGFVANQSVDEQQEWIDYDDFSVIDADGNFINSEIPFNTNNFYDIKIIVNFEQNLWHVKLNGIQILRDLALIPTTAAPSALTVTPY